MRNDHAAATVREFGVGLVDVQVRRINYLEDVQVKVFERMISERQRIAERSAPKEWDEPPRFVAHANAS